MDEWAKRGVIGTILLTAAAVLGGASTETIGQMAAAGFVAGGVLGWCLDALERRLVPRRA